MVMEPIGSILGRVIPLNSPDSRWPENTTEPEESDFYILSNDPRAVGTNPPPPVPCEFCGELRYVQGCFIGPRIYWIPGTPAPCTCPEAVKANEQAEAERLVREATERKAEEDRKHREKIRRFIGQSGMGERFQRRTFESFQVTAENKEACRKVRRYTDTFDELLPKHGQPEPGKNGLFIAGPKGTGKTHLAAAVANQLIQKGTPVICMTMIDLLGRIKRTFAKDEADEDAVLSLYKTVPLLIIDDMGKEPPTEWAIATIYNIVNGRYEAYMPTIITTNYDDQALVSRMTPHATGDSTTAEATLDRLKEMCQGIILNGESWRTQKALIS